jgi:molecular chaperone DnaK
MKRQAMSPIRISVRTLWALTTVAVAMGITGTSSSASSGLSSKSVTIGNQPETMIVSPNGKTAYVIYFNSSKIDVIGLAQNKIIDQIDVGKNLTDAAISPNGKRMYVTSSCSVKECKGSVFVINTSIEKVIGTIAVGGPTQLVQVSPNGQFIDVAVNDGRSVSSYEALSEFNIASGKRIFRVSIPVFPVAMALSKDGERAYLAATSGANSSGNIKSELDVVNLETGAKVATLGQGNLLPCSVAANPNGKVVYEAFCGGSAHPFDSTTGVKVFDVGTDRLKATIRMSQGTRGMTVTPNGAFLYASAAGTSVLDVVKTSNNSVVKMIAVPTSLRGSVLQVISVSPNGHSLYAINFDISSEGRFVSVKLPRP